MFYLDDPWLIQQINFIFTMNVINFWNLVFVLPFFDLHIYRIL